MPGGFGVSIVERFWDSFLSLFVGRVQEEVPVVLPLLQQAEALILGPTQDLTLHPAVIDVFNGMRAAGMLLLAFCTVISLAEVTEASIMGSSGGLITWFKRFLVASLMTFGGIHIYGLGIRLFNALLQLLRTYLDTHWSGPVSTGALYQALVNQLIGQDRLLVLSIAALTLLVVIILAFLVGGVRIAELILSIVIAPIVWPIYLIPSMDDIPRTALRGFLGLNALLLLTVAMVRTAIRLAAAPGVAVNVWGLAPALSLLVMTIFLPATIKRIVGQGHTGVGALMMAVNLATGLKFLSLGAAAGAAGAVASPPVAAGAMPAAAASSASAYPMATLSRSGGVAASPVPPVYEARATIPLGLPRGMTAPTARGIEAPPRPDETVIDLGQTNPGSGRFDTVTDIYRMGAQPNTIRPRREEEKE